MMSADRQPDVLVVGGGLIGSAVALELAAAGRRVTLLERSAEPHGASWAGAGILSVPHLLHLDGGSRLLELGRASAALYPAWTEALREESGVDPEYRPDGMVQVVPDQATRSEWLDAYQRAGVVAESLSHDALERRAAPLALGDGATAGLWVPGVAQVRNSRLLPATREALVRRGVDVHFSRAAIRLEHRGGTMTGVQTPGRAWAPGHVVLAAGPWTAELAAPLGLRWPTLPVRGQMVLLQGPPAPLSVLTHGDGYLVFRRDGRVLAGSTVEAAGFDPRLTPEGLLGILGGAVRLLPEVARWPVVTTWAGLRPDTPDHLPLLGQAPGFENLWVAAGHFRSGILMAPVTGQVLARLILGRSVSFDLAPFSPSRFSETL